MTEYLNASVVKTLANAEDTRRADIIKRDNGTFGFREHFYDAEYDAWHPAPCASSGD